MRLRYRYVAQDSGRHMIEQMQHMQQVHLLMHQLMVRAGSTSAGTWQPPADVYESEDALVVQVELAGVREEDIDITLFADHLAIAGTRRPRGSSGSAAYHLAGILYGAFRLDVPVMVGVRRDDVEASYEDGLLTVVLPKATAPSHQLSAAGPDSASKTDG